MLNSNRRSRAGRQDGVSMIEVLVAIVIVMLGLLGLAGLQSHAALADVEAFQRAQAIVLIQDMVDRVNANRRRSMEYVTSIPMGTGNGAVQDCSLLNGPALDLCEWHNALLGASESAGGLQVGAMQGARGCVVNDVPVMPRQFTVSVVWQGSTPTRAPATDCGRGEFGADDRLRRALTANVTIGCLQNDPATLLCVTP